MSDEDTMTATPQINEPGISRRRFLAGMSASAVVALHGDAGAGADQNGAAANPKTGTARLLRLRLRTAALDAMRSFYEETLELRVVASQTGQFTVAVGTTRMTFLAAEAADAAPFYHFAFNIPENKIRPARDWQLARTPLIQAPERLRDRHYPEDVIDYAHWNAHSIFFWDPGGNLVEYIARHDLRNGASGPFGPRDLLCASEIAFIVDDVAATASAIQQSFDMPQYRQGSDQFRALGDEHGLVLVFGRDRGLGFGERKPVGIFPTEAAIRARSARRWTAAGHPYEITSD